MKIQAKDVKKGQTIVWGTVTMNVDNIETNYQKNGKELKTFEGNITRSMGRGNKKAKYYSKINVKSETYLTLKSV